MEDAQEFQRDKNFCKKLVEVIGEFQQSVMSCLFFCYALCMQCLFNNIN